MISFCVCVRTKHRMTVLILKKVLKSFYFSFPQGKDSKKKKKAFLVPGWKLWWLITIYIKWNELGNSKFHIPLFSKLYMSLKINVNFLILRIVIFQWKISSLFLVDGERRYCNIFHRLCAYASQWCQKMPGQFGLNQKRKSIVSVWLLDFVFLLLGYDPSVFPSISSSSSLTWLIPWSRLFSWLPLYCLTSLFGMSCLHSSVIHV